ncbi:MAG TPA: NRDE family protein [Candidatus Desulfobacillus sp.]|nr:NRDE family protein [Candidatus Desulfobacillus sp.]
MCLILLAWQAHPEYPLVVAANRDEFFARPTAGADFWNEAPDVLAGRDLEAGGTWLGMSRGGRFAALTNFRDFSRNKAGAPSRGELVSRFLAGSQTPRDYLAELEAEKERYNGFNLLFGEGGELLYFSNCGNGAQSLDAGVYGLSNHLLDTPWPKVARGKSALAGALRALPDETPLFALLRDERIAPDTELPRTGISLEWERLLSAAFVRSADYGTRSATVLLEDAAGRVRFSEQAFGADGRPGQKREFAFAVTNGASR